MTASPALTACRLCVGSTAGRLRLASSVLLLLCVGCQDRSAAEFPTRPAHEEAPRRPAGIAVDLRSPPPRSRDQASTEDGLVTLRAPLGLGAAREVVDRFFEAVYGEDISAIAELLIEDAMVRDTRPRAKTKAHGATTLWRQRFNKRVYQKLIGRLVYRPADISTFRAHQLDALPLGVRYLALNDAVQAGDVVLHVPIITHSIKSQRLLGDDLYFWLRRRGSRYVIYQMAEDVPI